MVFFSFTPASLSSLQLMFSLLLASAGPLKWLKRSVMLYFPVHLIAFTALVRLCQVIFRNVFMLLILAFYILLFTWKALISFLMLFPCFLHFLWFLSVMIPWFFWNPFFFEFTAVFACLLYLYFPLLLLAGVWRKFFVKFIGVAVRDRKLLSLFFLIFFSRFNFNFWWGNRIIFIINIIVILDKCLFYDCTLPFCWTFSISKKGTLR